MQFLVSLATLKFNNQDLKYMCVYLLLLGGSTPQWCSELTHISAFTPAGLKGLYRIPRIEPVLTICKTNALPAVLSFCFPPKMYFLFHPVECLRDISAEGHLICLFIGLCS